MLTKIRINDVEISQTLIEDSRSNGYEVIDYPQIETIISGWLSTKEVYMYTISNEKLLGRVKSTEHNGSAEYIPQYHNVCHARVSGSNDPILICKFTPSENKEPTIFVAYLSDHPKMFGHPYEKSNPRRMREIRNKNENKLP